MRKGDDFVCSRKDHIVVTHYRAAADSRNAQFLPDEDRKVLFRLSSVRAVREEGECTFAIPANRDTVQLYACFKNFYSGAYTDSVYLGEW